MPALLGMPDPGAAFTAVIQLGSLAAVIVYFARDLFVDLPRAMFRDPTSGQGRLPLLIIVGTIPVVDLRPPVQEADRGRAPARSTSSPRR